MRGGSAVIMPLTLSRAANDGRQRPGLAVAGVATFDYGEFLLGPVVIGMLAESTTLKISFIPLALLAIVIAIAAPTLAKQRNALSRAMLEPQRQTEGKAGSSTNLQRLPVCAGDRALEAQAYAGWKLSTPSLQPLGQVNPLTLCAFVEHARRFDESSVA